jgi:DNA topoisomerase-1
MWGDWGIASLVPRLRRSDCNAPGITRRRRGRGFSYRWNGEKISDPETLERIKGLAIPPAWADVWICPWPHGHIQATGTDDAGRRQYRYHDAWRVMRDRQKFERVVDFGRALPSLRSLVEADLSFEAVTEERVLAAVVRLLDLGFFRIGGEEYARDNETFGIATLRKDHVRMHKGEMTFDYPAKGSIRRVITVADPATFELLKVLKRRKGGSDNLLAYKDGRRWCDVRSEGVNAYIRAGSGDEFSAKDFRTWSGTVLGAVELAKARSGREEMSKTARQAAARRAVKAVSEYLGNTPAVCRKSYIDPKLLDRFDAGETIASALHTLADTPNVNDRSVRETIESAVIDLISENGATTTTAAA